MSPVLRRRCLTRPKPNHCTSTNQHGSDSRISPDMYQGDVSDDYDQGLHGKPCQKTILKQTVKNRKYLYDDKVEPNTLNGLMYSKDMFLCVVEYLDIASISELMKSCSTIYNCLKPIREKFHVRALHYLIVLNQKSKASFDMECFEWLLGIAHKYFSKENTVLWQRFFTTSLERLNLGHWLTLTQSINAISKLLDSYPLSLLNILRECLKFEQTRLDVILRHPQVVPLISSLIQSYCFMVSCKTCSCYFFFHPSLDLSQKKAYLHNYLKWCYNEDADPLLRAVIEDNTFDKTEFSSAFITRFLMQKKCGKEEPLLTLYLKQFPSQQRLSLISKTNIDLFSVLHTGSAEICIWYFHRFSEDLSQPFNETISTLLLRRDFQRVQALLEKREQLGLCNHLALELTVLLQLMNSLFDEVSAHPPMYAHFSHLMLFIIKRSKHSFDNDEFLMDFVHTKFKPSRYGSCEIFADFLRKVILVLKLSDECCQKLVEFILADNSRLFMLNVVLEAIPTKINDCVGLYELLCCAISRHKPSIIRILLQYEHKLLSTEQIWGIIDLAVQTKHFSTIRIVMLHYQFCAPKQRKTVAFEHFKKICEQLDMYYMVSYILEEVDKCIGYKHGYKDF